MTPKGEHVFSSANKKFSERRRKKKERKREKLEDMSNRARKHAIETDTYVCSLALHCVESLVCDYMILTVRKMSLLSEREENYHHGNNLPDSSTLTSAMTLERNCGLWRICLFPRETVTTQQELRILTNTLTKHTQRKYQAQIHIHSAYKNIYIHNLNNTHTRGTAVRTYEEC